MLMRPMRPTDFSRVMRLALTGLIAASAAINSSNLVSAHEGHAALPSTGAILDGDNLLLSPAAIEAIDMQMAKVSLADLRDMLRLNARVALPWNRQAIVSTLMPGRITSVLIKPGESVRAGQKLAELESLELETLQVEMLQASEALRLSEQLLEQRRHLVEQGAITKSKLLETEAAFREKSATLGITIRKLRAVGLDQELLDKVRSTEQPIRSISITAPINGMIKHSVAREGQYVEEADGLFKIVDLSSLSLVGEVLEADVSRIKEGMPVQVTFAGQEYAGEIRHIRLRMDESKRTIGVVIPVDNRDGRLRPGMFGRMMIETGKAQETIVCPANALIETGTESYVLLRQGEGKFVRRSVQIGMRTRKHVEISTGLFPGDRVIVQGTQLLAAMFDSRGDLERDQLRDGAERKQRTAVDSSRTSTSSESEEIVLPGTVELPTHQKTYATTLIQGRIARILVEPGQQVQAGDVLAEIESLELRNLQLELLQSRAKEIFVEDTVRRLRPLAKEGITAARELWVLESELKNLRHSIESLKRKLELVGISNERIERIANQEPTDSISSDATITSLPIRAPSAGRVAEFDLVQGESVESQDKLFAIYDMSTIWVEGYVFDEDAVNVHEGQKAIVQFSAHSGLKVEGTVVRLAPALDSPERVLPVWIELRTTDQFFREGMFARVKLNTGIVGRPVAARPQDN